MSPRVLSPEEVETLGLKAFEPASSKYEEYLGKPVQRIETPDPGLLGTISSGISGAADRLREGGDAIQAPIASAMDSARGVVKGAMMEFGIGVPAPSGTMPELPGAEPMREPIGASMTAPPDSLARKIAGYMGDAASMATIDAPLFFLPNGQAIRAGTVMGKAAEAAVRSSRLAGGVPTRGVSRLANRLPGAGRTAGYSVEGATGAAIDAFTREDGNIEEALKWGAVGGAGISGIVGMAPVAKQVLSAVSTGVASAITKAGGKAVITAQKVADLTQQGASKLADDVIFAIRGEHVPNTDPFMPPFRSFPVHEIGPDFQPSMVLGTVDGAYVVELRADGSMRHKLFTFSTFDEATIARDTIEDIVGNRDVLRKDIIRGSSGKGDITKDPVTLWHTVNKGWHSPDDTWNPPPKWGAGKKKKKQFADEVEMAAAKDNAGKSSDPNYEIVVTGDSVGFKAVKASNLLPEEKMPASLKKDTGAERPRAKAARVDPSKADTIIEPSLSDAALHKTLPGTQIDRWKIFGSPDIGGGSGPTWKLPKELGGAKPRYKTHKLEFESDLDRALYIVANTSKRSKRDAEYMAALRSHPMFVGKSDFDIRGAGFKVRNKVKLQSKYKDNQGAEVIRITADSPPVPKTSASSAPAKVEGAKNEVRGTKNEVSLANVEAQIAANEKRINELKAQLKAREKGAETPPTAKGPLTPERPPMRPIAEADVPPQVAEDLQTIIAQVQRISRQSKSLSTKAKDFFLPKHLRGMTDVASLKSAVQSTAVLQKAQEDFYKAARREFPGQFMDQLDRDLEQFFLGRMDWTKLSSRNPQLTARAKTFAHSLLKEKEHLDKRLMELGVVPDEFELARESGLMDLYLARRYLAYAMPEGKWAKKLSHPAMADTLRKGTQYILEQMRKKNPNVSNADVTAEVLEVIRARDPLRAMSEGFGGAFKHLKERKDIPAALRELMGEVHSGTAQIAYSLGTQKALVARLELMHEIAGRPEWASPSLNEALGHTYRLPEHPAFGPMSGKFTSLELYESVGNIHKIDDASSQILHEVLGFVKGNQVALGGLGPLINSTVGNMWSGVLSGGLDLTRPMKSGAAFKRAWQSIRDYNLDPTGKTGDGWLLDEARRVGGDFFGFGQMEIGNLKSSNFMREMDKVFPDEPTTNMYEAWGKLNNLYRKYRDVQAVGGNFLDFTDRVFRMQSYASLRDKFLADIAARGEKSYVVREGLLQFRPEHTQLADSARAAAMDKDYASKLIPDAAMREVTEAAARLAARRVNQSFWNPTFVAPALDKMRKGMVGVVAPYITAAYETTRMHVLIPERLVKEPDLAMRLLVSSIAMGGAFGAGGLLRQLNGISDDEVEAARASMPDSQKHYKPHSYPLVWRDAKGRPQFFDLTRVWDPLRYSVGHPDDALWRRTLTNFVMAPIEGGGAEGPFRQAIEGSGFVRPGMQKRPPPFSARGMQTVVKDLMNMGLAPGVVNRAISAYSQYSNPSAFQEPLTGAQAIARGLGLSNLNPVTPGDGPSSLAQTAEFRGQRGELKRERRNIGRSRNLSDDEKDSRREKISNELQRIYDKRGDQNERRGKF
jgi:hypothetical protein